MCKTILAAIWFDERTVTGDDGEPRVIPARAEFWTYEQGRKYGEFIAAIEGWNREMVLDWENRGTVFISYS